MKINTDIHLLSVYGCAPRKGKNLCTEYSNEASLSEEIPSQGLGHQTNSEYAYLSK